MGRNGNAVKNIYKELGVGEILLIEDDPWSRDSLSTFFRIVGCSMHSAETAMDAVMEASRHTFDLILCEYQFPGVNGLAMLEMMGKIQPVAVKFLFTSYPIGKLAEEAARVGIHEVIRKPFTMAALEESLLHHFPRPHVHSRVPVGVE
ncbi:MAG: response regulator [bacterium]|jgi:DNA-binding NtrC family response regulator